MATRRLTDAELRQMVTNEFAKPLPDLTVEHVRIDETFRSASRRSSTRPAGRLPRPTQAELRVAAAVLPNPTGPRGPFTKSQRREVADLRTALGRKAGGSR